MAYEVINKTDEYYINGAYFYGQCAVRVTEEDHYNNRVYVQVYHSVWTSSNYSGATFNIIFYENGEELVNTSKSLSYGGSHTRDWTDYGWVYAGSTISVRTYAGYTAFSDTFRSVDTGTQYYTVPTLSWAVNYDANGGSGAPSSQRKLINQALTLSSAKPTRTGYTFKGWATSSTGSKAYDAGSSYTANSSITLYAVWEANELTIKYNANGGVGAPDTHIKVYADSTIISSVVPTRGNIIKNNEIVGYGFTFLGWNTLQDGSGFAYESNGYIDDSLIADGDAEITLYAQWQRNKYAITYNDNCEDEILVPEQQWKEYDIAMSLSDVVPTRDRYNFLGWAIVSNGSPIYQPGSTYPSINNEPAELFAVWELAYVAPTITDLAAVRCDSEGNITDEGTYAKVTGLWSVDTTVVPDNKVVNIKIEYVISDDTVWTTALEINPSETETVTSGSFEDYGIIGDGNILLNESYYIRVTVMDSAGAEFDGGKSFKVMVPQQFRTMDFGKRGKSIGFGQPASDEVDGIDFAMDVRFHNNSNVAYGNIPMKPIVRGEDLNDYKTVGFYYSDYAQPTGESILNMPPVMSEEVAGANASFTLEVLYGGANGALMQRATSCDMEHSIVCQRMFYGDVWGEWRDITFNGQKVLWSHPRGVYMNADQSATLDETISKQRNGIMLVFSAFDEENVTGLDYQWQFKFVPKHFALQNYTTPSANKGVCFVLAAKAFQYIATKYLYIYDETIQGDETNGLNGTADCGITYNNTHWVLRYVLGV